jgi:hypothetical protein
MQRPQKLHCRYKPYNTAIRRLAKTGNLAKTGKLSKIICGPIVF